MATDVAAAAAALLEARRRRRWLTALPEGARPADMQDVYAIQALVAAELGPIAGWKVGAPSPQAEPNGAPLHQANIHPDGAAFAAADFNITGIEGEIGYVLGKDLPPREAPYARDEVLDAIATLHPIIEVVDTRFVSLGLDPLSHSADQGSHGALVVGPAVRDWRHIDPPKQPVRLRFNGEVALEQVGGNTAGEPIRLIQWLADTGARRYGGLKAGMVITTGSCTGNILVKPGTTARVEFPGVGAVQTVIR